MLARLAHQNCSTVGPKCGWAERQSNNDGWKCDWLRFEIFGRIAVSSLSESVAPENSAASRRSRNLVWYAIPLPTITEASSQFMSMAGDTLSPPLKIAVGFVRPGYRALILGATRQRYRTATTGGLERPSVDDLQVRLWRSDAVRLLILQHLYSFVEPLGRQLERTASREQFSQANGSFGCDTSHSQPPLTKLLLAMSPAL